MQSFSIKYVVNVLYQIKEVPSISSYLGFAFFFFNFYHEYFFCISYYGSMIFHTTCYYGLVMDYFEVSCLVSKCLEFFLLSLCY